MLDWITGTATIDNFADVEIIGVDAYIGDGVTAISRCPHCGQVHNVHLSDSVAAEYAVDGFQTVLTLAPSDCAVCDSLSQIDGMTVTIDSIVPADGDSGLVWISYSCTSCGTENENHFWDLSNEENKIVEIIRTFGRTDCDYHITISTVCDACACDTYHAQEAAERSAALSAWRDNHNPILDGLTYAHGLSAYRGSRSVHEIFRSVDEIRSYPEWELCCTDTIYGDNSLVGEYGIYVKGTLTGLFEGDCWSEIDSQGNRYATRSNPIDLDDLFDLRACENNSRNYCEAWIKNASIVGVWITDRAARRWADVRDAMQSIANDLGVQLSIVQVRDSYDSRYDDMAVAMGYDY
nr:MAG TPA: hypothetical protein [Caudoviricetes sp.]